MFGSGNGFWTPTQNRPAMRAFVDSLRDRSGRRRRPRGARLVAELVALGVVTAGIFYGLQALL